MNKISAVDTFCRPSACHHITCHTFRPERSVTGARRGVNEKRGGARGGRRKEGGDGTVLSLLSDR